jgi:FKBP-type peptidyl-prolyl cis-trans isomerase 2
MHPGEVKTFPLSGRTASIIWILPDKALVDLNHPLAGQPLIVTLQIVTTENSSEGAGSRDSAR